MALARSGRSQAVAQMIKSLRDASHQNDTQSQVIANVGLALAEAIVDFHAGHFEDSFKRLAPVR